MPSDVNDIISVTLGPAVVAAGAIPPTHFQLPAPNNMFHETPDGLFIISLYSPGPMLTGKFNCKVDPGAAAGSKFNV